MKRIFTAVVILICSLNLVQAQIPSYVPTNGLVGWWPFNGNANDQSGNGYNAVNYGAKMIADRFGAANSAYYFDSSYMIVNNSSTLNFTNITINLWYLNHKISGADFVSKHQGATYNSSFLVMWENILGCGPVWYSTASTNQIDKIWASSFCDTVNWHMLTAVFTNGLMSLYIDGTLYQTKAHPSIKSTTLPIVFGGGSSPTPANIISYTDANIDDIGMWNRGLTSQEVQLLFSAGAPCPKISAIQGPTNLTVGNSITLTDSTAGGAWSVSNNSIASINTLGVLTGNSPGQVQVTYIANLACGPDTATYTVMVGQNNCMPSYVPTNGLVGWWPFCGNVNDQSIHAYTGTTYGSWNYTADRFGNANSAFNFNSPSRVETNATGMFTRQKISISVWVYSLDTFNRSWITKSNWSNSQSEMFGTGQSGKPTARSIPRPTRP